MIDMKRLSDLCHPERTREGSSLGRGSQILRGVPLRMTLLLLCLFAGTVRADDATSQPSSQPEKREKKSPSTKESNDEPRVTDHEVKLGETTLKYKATAGFIPL